MTIIQNYINSQLPKTKKARKHMSPADEGNLVSQIISRMYSELPFISQEELDRTREDFFKYSNKSVTDYSMSSVVHPHEVERVREPFEDILATHTKYGNVTVKGVDRIEDNQVIVKIIFSVKKSDSDKYRIVMKFVPLAELYISLPDRDISGETVQSLFLESAEEDAKVEVETTNLAWHKRGLVEIIGESHDRNGTLTYLVEPVNEDGESNAPKFDLGVEEMGSMDDHCLSHGRSFEVYECELTPYEFYEVPKTAKLCQPYTKGATDDRSNTLDEYVWVTKFMPRKPILDSNGDQVVNTARTRSGSVILAKADQPVKRKWFSQGEWKIIDSIERTIPVKSARGVTYVKKACVAQPAYEAPMVEAIGENTGRKYITKAFWLLDIETGDKLKWFNPETNKNKVLDVSEPTELSDYYDEFNYDPDITGDYQSDAVSSVEVQIHESVPLEGYVDTIDSITTTGRVLNAKEQAKFNKELKARDLDDIFKYINTEAGYWKVPKISSRSLGITQLKINFIQGAKVGVGLKLADVSFYKPDKKKTFSLEVYVSDTIMGELDIRAKFPLNDNVRIFFAQQVSYDFGKVRIAKAK